MYYSSKFPLHILITSMKAVPYELLSDSLFHVVCNFVNAADYFVSDHLNFSVMPVGRIWSDTSRADASELIFAHISMHSLLPLESV